MTHDYIAELRDASMRATDVFEALPDDASDDQRLAAAMEALTTGHTFLQSLARDPAPGVKDVAAEHRQGAIRERLRERMRETLPGLFDIIIGVVRSAPEHLAPGMTEADRQVCRAILLDNDLLTESELATFPRSSLSAIAGQRLAQRLG